MSSSIFIERNNALTQSNVHGGVEGIITDSQLDSNLVIVYGKNGISFDEKGIQHLIDERHVSSISVIRLTSPTPSMQDEEEHAASLNEQTNKTMKSERNCSTENSIKAKHRNHSCGESSNELSSVDETDSSDEEDEEEDISQESTDENSDEEDSGETNHKLFSSDSDEEESEYGRRASSRQSNDVGQRGKTRRRRHTRRQSPRVSSTVSTANQRKKSSTNKSPPHLNISEHRPTVVGLRVEDFYPTNDADALIKQALEMAGINIPRNEKDVDSEDADFQLYVIRNDHCYTSFTSPSQKKRAEVTRKAAVESNLMPLVINQPVRSGTAAPTSLITMKQLVLRKGAQGMLLAAPICTKSNNGKLLFTTKCASKRNTNNTSVAGVPVLPTNVAVKPIALKPYNKDKVIFDMKEYPLQNIKKLRESVDKKEEISQAISFKQEHAAVESDFNSRDGNIELFLNPKQLNVNKRRVKLVKIIQKNPQQSQEQSSQFLLAKPQESVFKICPTSADSTTNIKTVPKATFPEAPRLVLRSTPAKICQNTPRLATAVQNSSVSSSKVRAGFISSASSIPMANPVTGGRRILNKGVVNNIKPNIVIPSTSNQTHTMTSRLTTTLSNSNNQSYGSNVNTSRNMSSSMPSSVFDSATTSTHTILNRSVSIIPVTNNMNSNPSNETITTRVTSGNIKQIHLAKDTTKSTVSNHLIINSKLRGGVYLKSTAVEAPVVNSQMLFKKNSDAITTPTTLNTIMRQETQTHDPSTDPSLTELPVVSASSLIRAETAVSMANMNVLPMEMPLEIPSNTSEKLVTEEEKQLDLIDAIVKDELEKSRKNLTSSEMEDRAIINEDIPELVKMLKSSEESFESSRNVKSIVDSHPVEDASVLQEDDDIKNLADATVDDIDIADIELLASTDDLPDDILKDVVELMEKDSVFQDGDATDMNGCGALNVDILPETKVPSEISKVFTYNVKVENSTPVLQEGDYKKLTNVFNEEMDRSQLGGMIDKTTTAESINEQQSGSKVTQLMTRKEPIQIVRGNGRVITLPPIEAPTTRAKRRAQTLPTSSESAPKTNVNLEAGINESSTDVSMQSTISTGSMVNSVTLSSVRDRQNSRESINGSISTPIQKAQRRANTNRRSKRVSSNRSHTENESAPSNDETDHTKKDDDDPNKLWCVCRQPHNNRFMICCDVCEDWFHGTCVNITKAMGLEMEQKSIDWTCPNCFKKQELRNQPKITDMLRRKSITTIDNISTNRIEGVLSTTTTDKFNNTPSPDDDSTIVANKDVQDSIEDKKRISGIKNRLGENIEFYLDRKNTDDIHNNVDLSNNEVATTLKSSYGSLYSSCRDFSGESKKIQVSGNQLQNKQHPNATSATSWSSYKEKIEKKNKDESGKKAEQDQHAVAIVTSGTTCIVCKKPARTDTIYCSDDCIRRHAQSAINEITNKTEMLTTSTSNSTCNEVTSSNNSSKIIVPTDRIKKKTKELFEEVLSLADRKPKIERISVFERKSGRILMGSSAPTSTNLKKWLQDNPTFEVVKQGSVQAQHIEKYRQRMRLTNAASSTPTKATSSDVSKYTKLEVSPISGAETTTGTKVAIRTMKESNALKQPATTTSRVLSKYPQQVNIKPDKSGSSNLRSAIHSTLGKKVSKEKIIKKTSTAAVSSTETNNIPITAVVATSKPAEQVRMNVRRILMEHIMQRMDEGEYKDNTTNELQSDEKKYVRLSVDEVEELVKNIELAMFEYFNYDTGSKYRAKYRSLIFNIKDRKNRTLFAKICNKSIEPKQLVRLTAEEMASQELAQWREKETKHQLDIIKKSELDILLSTQNYASKVERDEVYIADKAIMNTDFENINNSIPVEDVASILNTASLSSSECLEEYERKAERSTSAPIEIGQVYGKRLTENLENAISPMVNSATEKTADSSMNVSEKQSEVKKVSSKIRDRERERDRWTNEAEKSKESNPDHVKRHKARDRHRSKSRSRKRSRSHSSTNHGHSVHSVSRNSAVSSKRHRDTHSRSRRSSRERGHHRGKERQHLHRESEKKLTTLEKGDGGIAPILSSLNQPNQKGKDKDKHLTNDETPLTTTSTTNNLAAYNLIDHILESTKTIEEAANLIVPSQQKSRENTRKTQSSSNSDTSQLTSNINEISVNNTQKKDAKLCNADITTSNNLSTTTATTSSISSSYAHSGGAPSEDVGNLTKNRPIWKGNINMIDVASFQISVHPVLGNTVNLGNLLPTELDVVGRISPNTVWEYIAKLRKSPNKEVVVTRLVPFTESEATSYAVLYQYLENRSRLGVIKTVSAHIKDFYIYPFGAGKVIPPVLTPSNGERVQLYEDSNRPDIMLGILIRIHGKRSQQAICSSNPIGEITDANLTSNAGGNSKAISKLLGRVPGSDNYSFNANSPKKKRHRSIPAPIDLEAIIKAPIASKNVKGIVAAPPPLPLPPLELMDDAAGDEPYSPGGSPEDLQMLSLRMPSKSGTLLSSPADLYNKTPVKQKTPDEMELAREMDELNRQIAAQEKEIAVILTRETSTNASSVLANISIPSNLSQILASIKAPPAAKTSGSAPGQALSPPLLEPLVSKQNTTTAPPVVEKPLMETLVLPPSSQKSMPNYDFKSSSSSKTSRLSQLTNDELLQMVPDGVLSLPPANKKIKIPGIGD